MNAYQPRKRPPYGYDSAQPQFKGAGTPIFGYDAPANWFTAFNLDPPGGNTSKLRQFTAKERDAESGLDYFGARYYGSALGRFTSPDLLLNSGRPDDPQTWNRYTYGLNNPLRYSDPTGLYNLDSGCLKDKNCSQYAKNLRNGIADLTKAVNGMNDGAEKDRLQASLKSLGTENDGNNVGVTFNGLDGSAAGHTDPVLDKSGNLSGWKITLDPNKIKSGENSPASDSYAIDAAHESTHINNLVNGTFTDFADEYRAYQTSAWSAGALWQYRGSQGTGTFTLNGRDVIWNSSWRAVDDKVLTNHIIQNYRYPNGKPYEETTPHDGGKP